MVENNVINFLKDVKNGGVVNKEFIASGDYEVVVRGKKYPAKVQLTPIHRKRIS